MAAMDDVLMASSDAELDSEVDDTDVELDHGSWATQACAGPSGFRRESSARMSNASKGAFEPGLDNNGVMTVDFDSILSELCDLEHQLNEQSILNAASSSSDPVVPLLPVPSTLQKPSDNSSIFKDYTNLKSNSPHKVSCNNAASAASAAAAANHKQTRTEIGSELDFALSELSSLVGTAFDVDRNSRPCSNHSGRPNGAPSDLKDTHKNNRFQNARESNNANNNAHARSNSMEHGAHPRKSSSTIFCGAGVAQNHWHEQLSDGGQNDSAFDDNVSLPSSGSRVSMATSSRSSGSSVTNSALALSNEVDEAQGCRGDPSKAHSHSNQNKVFVRVYSPEGSSESVLVTERMTVSQVIDSLLTKSHATPNMSWSLVEQLPNLLMERLLEDNECLTDNMLTWTKDSENKLVLDERSDKYDVFLCPEKYLTTTEDKNKKCDEAVRKVLIQEFLESNCRLPEFDGMLYIKLEGKKVWKKLYFILRASGIYYNPKGKSKSLIDLVCLQKLNLVEVYTGIGWQKKYKAPNDFGFALKHPQIQKKTPKYIKYLCAADMNSMWHWINCIRLAKYGQQLHANFQRRQSILHNGHDAVDSASKQKQAALIQEKISEMFSQQSESVSSFSDITQQSPSPSLQTFRAESPDDSPSRLLKSCLETNGSAPAKTTPLIPITTQITKQLSAQQTMRSPLKVPPKSPKKVVIETSGVQLPHPLQVTSDDRDDRLANSSPSQPHNHEVLHRSMDQLCSSGSPAFNADQKALKMAPPVTTGKWGTSQKHAVIKRATSIKRRESDDPPFPCPQVCAVSPKPLPLTAPSEVFVLPSPNSLPPVRRKFPSSSSFSDCDEGRILLTPQCSPKPKPPLPPKRKDILKPSPSVDSSPTKGRVAAIAGSLNLARKPTGDVRPSSTSSSQQSLSPRSPSPGGFTMKRSPSCDSGQTSSFLMDLQRVISQKQACGVGGLTDIAVSPVPVSPVPASPVHAYHVPASPVHANHVPSSPAHANHVPASPAHASSVPTKHVPVSPVPAAASRNKFDVDLDSLPPPPAALLEGLMNLKKGSRPPPPPKRSQETHLTYK